MKKILIITVSIFFTCFIFFSIIWYMNKIQNEKKLNQEYAEQILNEDLADRFDCTMYESYPFIRNVSEAVLIREQMFQDNAKIVYYENLTTEDFYQLNHNFIENTDKGNFMSYWLKDVDLFYTSLTYGYLTGAGEYREKEAKGIQKLIYFAQHPIDYSNMGYDSLMIEIDKRKLKIHKIMKSISSYENYGDINAWRFPSFSDNEIFKRYHKRLKKNQ